MEELRAICNEQIRLLSPLIEASDSPEGMRALLADLGWAPTSAPQPLLDLAVAGAGLVEMAAADDPPADGLMTAIKQVIEAILRIASAPDSAFPGGIDAASFKNSIVRDLIDYLIVEHLITHRHAAGAALKLAGLIRLTDVAAAGQRPAYVKREFDWDAFGTVLSDPLKSARDAYGWSTGDPKLYMMASDISSMLESYGLNFDYVVPAGDLLAFLNDGALTPDDESLGVDVSFTSTPEFSAGLQLLVLPPTAARTFALALLPYVKAQGEVDIALTEFLSLTIKGNADFTKGVALVLAPGQTPVLKSGFLGGAGLPAMEALVGLTLKAEAGQDIRLFGTPETSGFTIGSVALLGGARNGNGGQIDMVIDLELDDAKVIIKAGPDEADSFLASILPADGLSASFSLSMRLSSLTGFHLGGSGGLEAKFPSNIQIGPIELQGVTVGLTPEDRKLSLAMGATIAAKLGPLSGVVENMGLKLIASFPDPPKGNLGPVDIGFGFKPPNGVGLSLDLAVIKGGGYLFLDYDRGEYAGALEFTLADFVSVKAIGIINTKMPDGSKGFSLLLILTAEFSPGLQLSFGFTLIGVGGLVGLNRGMQLEPILAGVKTGAITGVMFPQNVVANAPRILNDLRAFFPPLQGTFLIGPMVKIGWGTPTLISVSMGVIIEIPGNLAILGVLQMVLPDKDAPVLRLNVAFAGGIDFQNKQIFFVAGLFDSRLLTMTIEGGLGFYLSYGDDPVFVLSVGGFHPRFSPPALPFQTPDRVAISVLSTALARIRVESYFAVTSNTAQFGARAEFFFGLGPCEVSGQFGFDALFQFNPFYFIIEVSGSASLKVFGVGVFSIHVDLSLEGPTPWRARGSGSISFLFFEVSANFDVTWGDAVSSVPQLVALMPLLETEINKIDSWKALPPPSAHLLVTLRTIDASVADLVIHPLGTLQLSQRVVPFGLGLQKFGEQKPSDVNRISVRPKDATLSRIGEVREPFAPAQFQVLDAAAKLSRKSYEQMPSGMSLGAAGPQYRTMRIVKRRVRYEEEIIDSNYKRFGRRFGALFTHLFSFFLAGSALAQSSISARSKAQAQPFADKIVLRAESFVVARQSNNRLYAANAVFASEAEAQDHLSGMDSGQRASLHVLPAYEVAA